MGTQEFQRLCEKFKILLSDFSDVYEKVKKEGDWKNPFRDIIAKDIPQLLKEAANIQAPYITVGSYGKGRWTAVPWVAVFDSRITTSAQKGVYLVNKDSKELYLALEVAATEVMGTRTDSKGNTVFSGVVGKSDPKMQKALKEHVEKIRKEIPNKYFKADDEINTGSSGYDFGAVYYKKYNLSIFPDGVSIVEDLKSMLDIYRTFYEKYYADESEEWWPSDTEYTPGITTDQWLSILNNQITIKPDWYTILGMFYTQKDGATCSALGIKFNRQPMSISGSCTQMAKRIFTETNCPLITDEGQDKYWPILFQGKAAASGETGSFVWRLRPELYDALTDFNILRYLPSDNGDSNKRTMPDSIKETISKIKTYIAGNGFSYPDGLIENFYLSLKSKPFVILAGTSGTGKTRLVKLFAEAIGADYYLVPVRPDWSDGSDLFGHTDLNTNFVKGPICAAFENAEANPGRPVFICLDEMNLARVEYYLSDFLSVIESREKEADGSIRTSTIAQYEGGIPENLYIVGTVNMDETTFPFSRKVLDRANTIEFNYVDLMPAFEDAAAGEEPLALPNEFLRSEYLLLVRDCAEDAPYVGENCSILQEINGILLEANAHVGYRVRDEIVFYMLNNEHAEGLISKDQAMDNEIMQKILPRIQGSSASVKTMLCRLFAVCAADHNQKSGETDSEKMRKILKDEGVICRYKKSAEKIEMMVRRFEEDGFTSYWL